MALNFAQTIGNTIAGGGLANAISGSQSESGGSSESNSYGGSQNSASSISGSNAWSDSGSESSGWSNTAGLQASANSALEAQKAHERQKELLQIAQEFNSREAQKQRDWQADMANTVYTRSVKNMIEAGINPILAANLGLSAGNINSGATASINTPSSFMGQTFAEQNSASGGSSWGKSESSSFGKSSSQGSSWQSSNSHSGEWSNSQSGLATGLRQMMELGQAGLDAITSSEALKWAMDAFNTGYKDIADTAHKYADKQKEGWQDFWNNGFGQSFMNSWSPWDEHWNGHY